jgi:hypothetical protein
MWLSTKRSIHVEYNKGKRTGPAVGGDLRLATTSAAPSSKAESSKVRADDDNNSNNHNNNNNNVCDWSSTLPLDWTRLSQQRKRTSSTRDYDNDSTEATLVDAGGGGRVCCTDPSNCRKRHHVRPRLESPIQTRTINDTSQSESTVLLSSSSSLSYSSRVEGRVIFCLPETDPSWVQGYFLPQRRGGDDDDDGDGDGSGSKKPWRLLAIQEEVDECLACNDGGYRRLSLTVYPSTTTKTKTNLLINNNNNPSGRNDYSNRNYSYKIESVDWTGGDMMSLYHPQYVDMEGERVLTGTKALPILTKYFQGLVRRLAKGRCNEDDEGTDNIVGEDNDPIVSVLSWLPDVAIVIGTISLSLPTSETR